MLIYRLRFVGYGDGSVVLLWYSLMWCGKKPSEMSQARKSLNPTTSTANMPRYTPNIPTNVPLVACHFVSSVLQRPRKPSHWIPDDRRSSYTICPEVVRYQKWYWHAIIAHNKRSSYFCKYTTYNAAHNVTYLVPHWWGSGQSIVETQRIRKDGTHDQKHRQKRKFYRYKIPTFRTSRTS